MEKYHKERFETQSRLAKKIAQLIEVNDILEIAEENQDFSQGIEDIRELCLNNVSPY